MGMTHQRHAMLEGQYLPVQLRMNMSDLKNLHHRMKSFKSLTKRARLCFFVVVLGAVVIEASHYFGSRVGIEQVGQQVSQLLILFASLILVGEMGGSYIASKIRDTSDSNRK